MGNAAKERIPMVLLSRAVQNALGFAATVIEEDHGTKNGRTALYWHLVNVAQQHMKTDD